MFLPFGPPPQFMLSRAVLQRLRPVLSPAKYLQRKRALLYSTVTTQASGMDAVNTSHKVIIVGGGPAGMCLSLLLPLLHLLMLSIVFRLRVG